MGWRGSKSNTERFRKIIRVRTQRTNTTTVTLPLWKSVGVWGPVESSQYRKGHLETMGLYSEGVVPYIAWCLLCSTSNAISSAFGEGNGWILEAMATLPVSPRPVQGVWETQKMSSGLVVGPNSENKESAEAH